MSAPQSTIIGRAQLLGALYGAGTVDSEAIRCEISAESPVIAVARAWGAQLHAPSPARTQLTFLGAARHELQRYLGARLREFVLDATGAPGFLEGSAHLQRAFLRGWVEVSGCVQGDSVGSERISLCSPELRLSAFCERVLGPAETVLEPGDPTPALLLRWTGLGALDAVGRLFEPEPEWACPAQLALFRRWCLSETARPCELAGPSPAESGSPALRVQRLRSDAVLPFKARVSDSGYDLTLLGVEKRYGEVALYQTGLRVEPPPGYYLDVVPRSSIIKLGYLMANSVGVIDRAYRGELLIPLIRTDPKATELALPARVAQMIPRAIQHFPVVEVDQLGSSARGARGFGSSGSG